MTAFHGSLIRLYASRVKKKLKQTHPGSILHAAGLPQRPDADASTSEKAPWTKDARKMLCDQPR